MTFNYRVDGTGIFTITKDGFVALNVDDLDYETLKKVSFKAIVTEAGVESPKSSTADITVTILDENDNSPKFPPSGYSVTIKEGEGRRPVVKVTTHTHL